MTLLMPSSGTCGPAGTGRLQGRPAPPLPSPRAPPPSPGPRPSQPAHQGMVKVEGADVVGGDVGRSQGAGDLGHDPTLI